MNKQNKLNTVANAALLSNEHATLQSSVYAAIAASDALKAYKPGERLLAKTPTGDAASTFDLRKTVHFNSQGLLDCYLQLDGFDFRGSFRKRFKERCPADDARIDDQSIYAGIQEIGLSFSEDCQAMIPAIASKWSGTFNTGRGEDNKQIPVASYATTHNQFVKSGLRTVLVDQLADEIHKLQKQSFVSMEHLQRSLTEVCEYNRFTLSNRQVAANVIGYSFLVASNIVACKFSKTFDNKGCRPFYKTSDIYAGLVENRNVDAIATCSSLIAANRLDKVADAFMRVEAIADSRKWTEQDKLAANAMMLDVASMFMQKHFDNLKSMKYIDSIIDKQHPESIA